ncbi:hypothetical protein C0995_015804 [Termitomyces sp. Mi166|nr:hypothetical protein C0995_015804 [Termitomyces sp. Mi166\
MSIASARTHPLANWLLFPAFLHNAVLSPLLGSPELYAEIYDVVALALQAFVMPWWSKISRYDKQFLPEIIRVLAAVVRTLNVRIQAAQLIPLFVHVPVILTHHYRDYRNAIHAKVHI